MREFRLVTGRPFTTICSQCFIRGWAGDGYRWFANIKGKPFTDYYCEPCKNKREQA